MDLIAEAEGVIATYPLDTAGKKITAEFPYNSTGEANPRTPSPTSTTTSWQSA